MELVSIVTPSYNCSKYILCTINSILSQSFLNWELIIVDDCSSDNSVEVIKSFVNEDARIKLIQLSENSGAAVARNTAIEASQGRYIAFLDSDDLWHPEKLEKQIKFMQHNEIAFSYSAYEKINECGDVTGSVGVPDKAQYSDLLKVCSIGCLTAIYDTKLIGKIYMPLIRKRQDLGLWLRILKKIPYAYATPGVLSQYRVRSDSISANKKVAAQYTWKLYREVENLSFLSSVYYFSHYAMNGFLRTKLPKLAKLLGVLK